MCGRFTLRASLSRLIAEFAIGPTAFVLDARYNIAPSQPVVAVRRSDTTGGRELCMLRWGLVPSWADDPSLGSRMINARAESVADKPAFRGAFARRRCLVPADGYYEWQALDKPRRKQPYFIHLQDEGLFAFAAVWEAWSSADGEPLETCAIITTDANEQTAAIHHRMPVILGPADYDVWLQPSRLEEEAWRRMRQPFAGDRMAAYPVSTLVNHPRHDRPDCLSPWEGSPGTSDGTQMLF